MAVETPSLYRLTCITSPSVTSTSMVNDYRIFHFQMHDSLSKNQIYRAGVIYDTCNVASKSAYFNENSAGFSAQNGIGSKATFVVWGERNACRPKGCWSRAAIAKLWLEAGSGSGGVHSPPEALWSAATSLLI